MQVAVKKLGDVNSAASPPIKLVCSEDFSPLDHQRTKVLTTN